MKVCTKCNRTYNDDSLAFCLECGSPLQSGSSSGQSAQTLIMNNPTEVMKQNPTYTAQPNPTTPHYHHPTNVSSPNPSLQQSQWTQHSSYPPPSIETAPPVKPSAAGRISALLCMVATIASFVLFTFSLVMVMNFAKEVSGTPFETILGLIILISIFLPPLGTIFGLFGVYLAFRAGKGQGAKKTAVLGIVVNLIFILGLVFLFILGTIGTLMEKA